jgi:DNA polymerase-1
MRSVPLTTPIPGTHVHSVRSDEDARRAHALLDSGCRIAFDTETTGVGYFDELRLVQFSDRNDAYVFEPQDWPDLVHKLATHPNRLAHNANFDANHLARFTGLPVATVLKGVTDTFLLSKLRDPRRRQDGNKLGHKLKPLVEHFISADFPDGDKALKAKFKENGWNSSTGWANICINDVDYRRYAALDCLGLWPLGAELEAEVKRLALDHLVPFDHRVNSICAEMREIGFAVDLPYTQALADELREECERYEQRARLFGIENLNSRAQVQEALLARGCELSKRTPSGELSVSGDVLKALDDDVARLVTSYRDAAKALATWVNPFLEHGSHDGRLHAQINSMEAKTFRMSITNPALQTLPKKDYRIRSCLTADEGHVLVACDLDQIELRVMAQQSNEPRLLDMFHAGQDLHSEVAARLYGPDFTPEQRSRAKAVNFGVAYGQGAKSLAESLGISRGEAKADIGRFFGSLPRLHRWIDNNTESVRDRRPSVITMTGRRIPVDVAHGKAYTASNYLIQSLAGDIFKDRLIAMHDAGLGPMLRLPIHDEILLSVPKEDAEEVARTVTKIMSTDLEGCPITATAEILPGHSWGSAYAPKESNV